MFFVSGLDLKDEAKRLPESSSLESETRIAGRYVVQLERHARRGVHGRRDKRTNAL